MTNARLALRDTRKAGCRSARPRRLRSL